MDAVANETEAELERLYAEAKACDERRDYLSGVAPLAKALRLAEEAWDDNDPRLIRLLTLMAHLRRYDEDASAPVPYLQRSVRIGELAYGDAPILGSLLGRLAQAQEKTRPPSDVRHVFDRALDLLKAGGDPWEQPLSYYLGMQAKLVSDLNPAEGVPYCEWSLALEAKLEPNGICHFQAVWQLGRTLLAAERPDDALEQLKLAKYMLERGSRGQPHPWMPELDELIARATAAT